jgi:hypothetical protein
MNQSMPHPQLTTAVETLFRQSLYLQLRRVWCEEQGDKLVLHGQLPTYYLKQIAQTTVAPIVGEHHIVNEIEVVGH